MVKQAKDQSWKPGWKHCSFCQGRIVPDMSDATVLDNNGLRFPAHLGCWYDHAHDSWQDAMLERNQPDEPPDFGDREPPAEEQIMTEREEIAYEAWMDRQGGGL